MSIIESFVPAGVVHIIFSQTVLTPFDLLPAEILLKIEREWVQNVAAILCQNGQFGSALPWTLPAEDKETFGTEMKANLQTGKLADLFVHLGDVKNSCLLYLLYLWAAVFVERKYAEDINRPRPQYFSSKQTFHCIFKGRRRKRLSCKIGLILVNITYCHHHHHRHLRHYCQHRHHRHHCHHPHHRHHRHDFLCQRQTLVLVCLSKFQL